jgi:glycosyltransferase involved in cell wall biosynthesis
VEQAQVVDVEEVRPPVAPAVSVIIPTLNEAANLPHILPMIPAEYEVVVVDGNSMDDTMAVARALRPDAIVMRQPRKGKGDALFAGFAAASGDILITLDADGSQKVDELRLFVDALVQGADFAKGSRLCKGGGSVDFTWLRAAGNRALGMAANRMHGTRYTDLTYGYNAFWRHALPHLATGADGFEGEVIMCIRAARAGLRITEVPCYEEARLHGESNLRTFRDGWKIFRMLVDQRGQIDAIPAGHQAQTLL